MTSAEGGPASTCRRLLHRQVVLDTAGIAQEGPSRSEPCPEGSRHLGEIDADRHEAGVGHFRLILELDELPEETLLLRTPPAAVEVHECRVTGDDVAQSPHVSGVIEQLEIRKYGPGSH